jgi:hypothetical protein
VLGKVLVVVVAGGEEVEVDELDNIRPNPKSLLSKSYRRIFTFVPR